MREGPKCGRNRCVQKRMSGYVGPEAGVPGLERILWAVLERPGSDSSLRKLTGWQRHVGGKEDRKQNPFGCYSPVLVRMVRESGRKARMFRKWISKAW